jgi:hypothetical protein
MDDALGVPAGVNKPVLTHVAIVAAQTILVMMVREVLNQCQEVEIRLVTYRPAELAVLERRDRINLVICEPLLADELRGMLHPDQRLIILTHGGSPEARRNEVILDLAKPSWPATLMALARAPRAGSGRVERRRLAMADLHSKLAAALQRQPSEAAAVAGGFGSAAACQRALGLLPGLGQPTALIFLGLHRLVRAAGEALPLLQILRSAVRSEDAIFRIDDFTVAVLAPTVEARSVPSLLTRLSWRIWPSDPVALAAGYAVWNPGEDVDPVIETAWSGMLGALGTQPAS